VTSCCQTRYGWSRRVHAVGVVSVRVAAFVFSQATNLSAVCSARAASIPNFVRVHGAQLSSQLVAAHAKVQSNPMLRSAVAKIECAGFVPVVAAAVSSPPSVCKSFWRGVFRLESAPSYVGTTSALSPLVWQPEEELLRLELPLRLRVQRQVEERLTLMPKVGHTFRDQRRTAACSALA